MSACVVWQISVNMFVVVVVVVVVVVGVVVIFQK